MDQQSKETGAEEEDSFMMFTQHPNEPTHKALQATVNLQMPGWCPQAAGNKALQRGSTESRGDNYEKCSDGEEKGAVTKNGYFKLDGQGGSSKKEQDL